MKHTPNGWSAYIEQAKILLDRKLEKNEYKIGIHEFHMQCYITGIHVKDAINKLEE